MTLRKEKYFKVTEYHLPMVLFKYWFKFSLTGLRKKKIILHKIYSILTFEKGELVQCFNTSAFRCNSIVKSLPSIRFLHPPSPHPSILSRLFHIARSYMYVIRAPCILNGIPFLIYSLGVPMAVNCMIMMLQYGFHGQLYLHALSAAIVCSLFHHDQPCLTLLCS